MNAKTTPNQMLRPDLESYRKMDKPHVIIIAQDIRSALNVGSMFRSADAFFIRKVFLCGICAVPPNKEIQKTALGATESVEWEYIENCRDLVQSLLNEGWQVYAAEQTHESIALHSFVPDPDLKYAIVFGNEVDGVSEDVISLSTGSIEIPQAGTKHSLNVAVAAGVVMWHFFQHLNLANSELRGLALGCAFALQVYNG